VGRTFRWIGSKFSDGITSIERLASGQSGDLASRSDSNGGPLAWMVASWKKELCAVTHIYRRIDGRWKLVHRHAEYRLRTPATSQLPDSTAWT
jgi:hypothetical protein